MSGPRAGEWWHSLDHNEPCRVVDMEVLWNQATCLVWLPRRGTTVRMLQDRLVPLRTDGSRLLDRLCYVSAAARIADALERDTLVAPLEGTVIPLPHQIHALQRAMSGDRIRYLLADEVGLGKTIEAGLIFRELKIRGLVRRILVVAPAGLVTQWVSEMKTHFNEDFRLIIPGNLAALRQVAGLDDGENLWRMHDQVVCPLDSVKPLESRRGWSSEQTTRYNHERFEDLVSAGWDLIVVDEAHRLGGSTEQVARFKLGESLAQAAPYLLLLTATPHQGKSESFRRIIGFIDPDALPPGEAITRDLVAPYVTNDTDGIPRAFGTLFRDRFAWRQQSLDKQIVDVDAHIVVIERDVDGPLNLQSVMLFRFRNPTSVLAELPLEEERPPFLDELQEGTTTRDNLFERPLAPLPTRSK